MVTGQVENVGFLELFFKELWTLNLGNFRDLKVLLKFYCVVYILGIFFLHADGGGLSVCNRIVTSIQGEIRCLAHD